MIDLDYSKSICELQQKIIVCKENHSIYEGQNVDSSNVYEFKVDGDIFPPNTQIKRCDYLIINATKKDAYFIELKGVDIEEAFAQIESGVNLIKCDECNIHARIVASRVVSHRVPNTAERKFRHRFKDTIIRSKFYSENI